MYDNPFRIPADPRKNPIYKQCGKGAKETEQDRELFNFYFTKIVNLALSRYEYENLPAEIPPMAIESILLWQGVGIMFRDITTGLFAFTKVALTGNIDIYDIPTDRLAYATTMETREFNKDNSVLCWARPLSVPEITQIIVHCNSLVNMRTTREMNIVQQRTPVAIAGSQDARLDSANLVNKILSGIPFLRVNKNFSGNIDIQPLNFNVPQVFNEMNTAMLREMSDCLSGLGIEASGIEKAERLVSSETSYNNGEIEMARKSGLLMRERFCNAINKLWGLNVSVKFNSTMLTPMNIENIVNNHNNLYKNIKEGGENVDFSI